MAEKAQHWTGNACYITKVFQDSESTFRFKTHLCNASNLVPLTQEEPNQLSDHHYTVTFQILTSLTMISCMLQMYSDF